MKKTGSKKSRDTVPLNVIHSCGSREFLECVLPGEINKNNKIPYFVFLKLQIDTLLWKYKKYVRPHLKWGTPP
jgi:hypothetical protein